MSRLYLLLLLNLWIAVAKGQVLPDSVNVKPLGQALSKLRNPMTALGDTLVLPSHQNELRDSLLTQVTVVDSIIGKAAILPKGIGMVKESIDSVLMGGRSYLDSLSNRFRQDSTKQNVILAMRRYSDSLKILSDSLMGKLPSLSIQQTKSYEAVTKLHREVEEKLSLLRGNGFSDVPSLPEVGIDKLEMPALPLGRLDRKAFSLPDLPTSLPGSDLKIPSTTGIGLPATDLPQGSSLIGDIEVPSLATDLAIPKVEVPSVLGKIEAAQEQVGELKAEANQLRDVQNQAEDRLSQTALFGEVKEQIDLADQAKRYFDPEVAKEEMLNKAKQEAINHFAGHEEELRAAMQKLSQLKAKIPNPEGVLDAFDKHPNRLGNRTFTERLVTGFAFQVQKLESFWFDLNPNTGYKFGHRIVSGLGINVRLAYDFKRWTFDKQNSVYGVRTFFDVKVRSNFWLRAELECMNSPLRATQLLSSEIIGRKWVMSYFAGIRRDFQLGKRLKGNIQTLYNLYNPDKQSPYVNRLNVRMGLELPVKSDRKKRIKEEQKSL